MANKTKIIGKVVFLSKGNASGWYHGKIKDESGEKWSISGTALSSTKDGGVYEFEGEIGTYKGEAQFKVDSVLPEIKETNAGLTKYLMDNFTGVGQKTAKEMLSLWTASGMTIADMKHSIIHEPYKIEQWTVDAGLSKKIKLKTEDIKGHPSVVHVYKSLSLQHKLGVDEKTAVPDAVLKKVSKFLLGIPDGLEPEDEAPIKTIEQALQSFKEDPYSPIFGVDGYGFLTADKIWEAAGGEKKHNNRLAALGLYVLEKACDSSGHTFLYEDEYKDAISEYDRSINMLEIKASLLANDIPVIEEDGKFFSIKLLQAERNVVAKLAEWAGEDKPLIKSQNNDELVAKIREIEKSVGFPLDKEQEAALLGIATSGSQLHTLTAMPGCGKTAIMEFLAKIVIDSTNKNILFMAPTGKAAKVLDKRVKAVSKNLEAVTIHSAIGYGNEDRNEEMLDADVIVVDEFSMVDIQLMSALLRKMKSGTHLIAVGDNDQLPSVGPGSVLRDILKMNFDHHRLSEIHRNSGNILNLVKCIKDGEYKKFQAKEGEENDLLVYGLPELGKIPNVITKYIEEINKRPFGAKKVCLLTGLRKGDPSVPGWNVTYLNKAIQARMNPEGDAIPGFFMRINDRIICKKNKKYEIKIGGKKAGFESVANGDTGTILDVKYSLDRSKIESVIIDFDDGRLINLPGEILNKMDLAYALTVHSSQGSEFECAMVVMPNGYRGIFNRKMLYTGVSRAKQKLYLFGDAQNLKNMIDRKDDKRNSFLVERFDFSMMEKNDQCVASRAMKL